MSKKQAVEQREEFCIIGQAHDGLVRNFDVELIIDTNVVSVAETIVRKGYNSSSIQHQRFKNLYQWIRNGTNIDVSPYAGSIESSGFDGCTVSPYQLTRRLGCAQLMFRLALSEHDVNVFSGDPVIDSAYPEVQGIDGADSFARDFFGTIFFPNYIALLKWRELTTDTNRRTRTAIDSCTLLRQLATWLADSINYIPLAWSMLIYSELGTFDTSRTVSAGLLKLDKANVAKSMKSAAYDIGLLSYISMLRAADSGDTNLADSDRRLPVLVTDDEQFAKAAAMLTARGDSGLFAIEFDLLRPEAQPYVTSLLAQHHLERSGSVPSFPAWEGLVDIVIDLQTELKFDEIDRFRRDTPVIELEPDGSKMTELLQLLESKDRAGIVDALSGHDSEYVFAALFLGNYTVMAMQDIDADRAEVFMSAAKHAFPEFNGDLNQPGSTYIGIALALLDCWLRDDDTQRQIHIEHVFATESWRVAYLLILLICQTLMTKLADNRSVELSQAYEVMRRKYE